LAENPRPYRQEEVSMKSEQIPIPIWQRLFCGIFVLFGSFVLPYPIIFMDTQELSSLIEGLGLIASSLYVFWIFGCVAIKGRLPERFQRKYISDNENS